MLLEIFPINISMYCMVLRIVQVYENKYSHFHPIIDQYLLRRDVRPHHLFVLSSIIVAIVVKMVVCITLDASSYIATIPLRH